MAEDKNIVQEASPSDLLNASLVADVIRRCVSEGQNKDSSGDKIFHEQQQQQQLSFRFPVPPGVVEGVAAGLVVGGLSLPIRRKLLQIAGPRLHVLTELIVTPIQALVAFQAGMFTCSLYGSSHYLQRLAEIPIAAPSATADAICQDETVQALWTSSRMKNIVNKRMGEGAHSDSTLIMDPRIHTLKLMERALIRCRERHEYQQEQQMFVNGPKSVKNNNKNTSWF